MKITITPSTTTFDLGGRKLRAWHGTTESGAEMLVFVVGVALDVTDGKHADVDAELARLFSRPPVEIRGRTPVGQSLN